VTAEFQSAVTIAPESAVEAAATPQRPSLDIESLRNFLDSIRSFAGAELILESPSVNRLYHYTDLSGLNGIVSSNDLWLTHLRFSNDDEEMIHGQNIVTETLQARKKKSEPAQKSGSHLWIQHLNSPPPIASARSRSTVPTSRRWRAARAFARRLPLLPRRVEADGAVAEVEGGGAGRRQEGGRREDSGVMECWSDGERSERGGFRLRLVCGRG
jgi:hypothetical protein